MQKHVLCMVGLIGEHVYIAMITENMCIWVVKPRSVYPLYVHDAIVNRS